jgi:hypothetical protein
VGWIKRGEVLAEVRRPQEGWPSGAVDLIKQIATQEGYRVSEGKLPNFEVGKLEIILPKTEVQKFQAWLDARSLGQTFVVIEQY